MYKIKILLKTLSLFLVANTVLAGSKKWVYFDLGNTLVNTRNKTGFFFYKGALSYLKTLKQMNFNIGIISNIPESFGQTHEEKLETLKTFIKDKWIDKEILDWNLFDHILLPLNNTELKPAKILYIKAIEKADFCPMAYISENLKEVIKAIDLGIAGHLFLENDEVDFDKLYIPLENIEHFIKENSTLPGC